MTPELESRVLGVRLLARSMARKRYAQYRGAFLDADDLEQSALTELCSRLERRPTPENFEGFAWYAFRDGIFKAVQRATWRKHVPEIEGRSIIYGTPMEALDVAAPEELPEHDCVVCGGPVASKRKDAFLCSLHCKHKFQKIKLMHGIQPTKGTA